MQRTDSCVYWLMRIDDELDGKVAFIASETSCTLVQGHCNHHGGASQGFNNKKQGSSKDARKEVSIDQYVRDKLAGVARFSLRGVRVACKGGITPTIQYQASECRNEQVIR